MRTGGAWACPTSSLSSWYPGCPGAHIITAHSLRQLLLTLAPSPAQCQVLGGLPALPACQLSLFHHARDPGNPICPAAGISLPGLTAGKVPCVDPQRCHPPWTHNAWITLRKPLRIKAFCSRLSFCLRASKCPSLSAFLKMLHCKAGSHSILCPVHCMCTNMPSGEAGSLQSSSRSTRALSPSSPPCLLLPCFRACCFPTLPPRPSLAFYPGERLSSGSSGHIADLP